MKEDPTTLIYLNVPSLLTSRINLLRPYSTIKNKKWDKRKPCIRVEEEENKHEGETFTSIAKES